MSTTAKLATPAPENKPGDEPPYRQSHVPGVATGTQIRLASFRATDKLGAIGVEMIGTSSTPGIFARVRMLVSKENIPILIAALEAHLRASPEDPTP